MIYVWIGLIIVLTLIEIFTTNLTTIWFVASALAALGVSFICDSVIIQFTIFALLGIFLLIITKPLVKKFMKVEGVKTNLDRVIGMKGIVTQDIVPMNIGEIKVDGKLWSAISDEKLVTGDIVEILQIDSVKLKVKKWED